jgi:predicted TIM-barrel fold metal-dependent hydrolase
MKRHAFILMLVCMIGACCKPQTPKASSASVRATDVAAPSDGIFSYQELQQFSKLDPIDAHTHVQQSNPAFYAMLKRLNLHIVDILLVADTEPQWKDFAEERKEAWSVVHDGDGRVILCTTFNPYRIGQRDFSQEAIRQLNEDFSRGAIAVKIWKNVGMEIKDAKGNYILPDNPAFEPIFKDIAAHNKTLIAHLADPDSIWQAPNPAAADYNYYMHHTRLYMYGRSGAPTKAEILQARDRILERNPDLRMVGAHFGSMESDFDQVAAHFDRYPNFAVDISSRMVFMEKQPRAKMIAFITRYQDRLIYGTDNYFFQGDNPQKAIKDWEDTYADDWRYLATDDTISYGDHHSTQGLALPQSILHKLYHDNALRWYPGLLSNSH